MSAGPGSEATRREPHTTVGPGGGVALHWRGEGPTWIGLHGFTGRASDFQLVADSLPHLDLAAFDLPGHGRSDPASGANMSAAIEFVEAATRTMPAPQSARILGYSMGGRIALHFATRRPEQVARVAVIGAHPGLTDPTERAARTSSDDALAGRIIEEGVERFLHQWSQVPIIATQDRIPDAVRERMRAARAEHRAEPLAAALRGLSTGRMEPVGSGLAALGDRLSLFVGKDDAKYRALLATAAEFAPRASLDVIGGAGHAAHLEAPRAFAAAFRARCLDEPTRAD